MMAGEETSVWRREGGALVHELVREGLSEEASGQVLCEVRALWTLGRRILGKVGSRGRP